ncbi:DUF2683 family protein [Dyadobacter fermentans]|uniref:Uncharacterized protein n=1 Tax=Dyadobacter fermentans (strain ATCC 700827 / DSM 18053 / CIP 107007 / KCTC 52180 / NS114) TaxID=471854 RepID=C6W3E9_DYAFD|nr:DUF2683 family protein [Dyadobacter fermentans]ACT93926.1 hypothetical protein Dfer_2710 [Dyadobacter fermentans DSM 18053]
MTTLTIKTENQEVMKAVRALSRGFKVAFEEKEDKPYDPEFVAMIKESEQQINEGKTVQYEPGTNVWDLANSK